MTVLARWDHVTKQYGRGFSKKTALNNFSFELESGETAALVGNNGSGKSTAIQCLLGTLRPTSGTVSLREAPPHSVESRRDTGYLPEQFGLFPATSVRNILRSLYELKGLPPERIDEELQEIRELLKLSDFWETPLVKCSHGQRQRVGLAQALLGDPSLLFLDEPTAGLDPETQEQFYRLIHERNEENKTTLLVTHRMEEVKQLCQRAVVLEDGSLKSEGPIDEVVKSFDRTESP